MTVYAEWTYDQVRAQIIEAAHTLRASPADAGPGLKTGAMASVLHEMVGAFGESEHNVRRAPPSAGAISRMYQVWDWINSYLDEDARKLVYEYSFIKTRKGIYIEAYLRKIDMSRSTFERRIQSYCQQIADNLNQKHQIRLTVTLDGVTETGVEHASTTVNSKKCATDWRDYEVIGQKEKVRAHNLAYAKWRNERRRQILERAER
ncbi:DUF6362 family protein [Rhizobium pusense]|uniref:DUF6362 family protein n=1 Tax=Agrobacterium pusense TaxID=648995 RepID=UPI00244BE2D6|nr:DUF6362 family protein [Agrobacterium pusense]MDH0114060.1 DUF6362 family protein [Agrobacterium pusense]